MLHVGWGVISVFLVALALSLASMAQNNTIEYQGRQLDLNPNFDSKYKKNKKAKRPRRAPASVTGYESQNQANAETEDDSNFRKDPKYWKVMHPKKVERIPMYNGYGDWCLSMGKLGNNVYMMGYAPGECY